MIDLARLRSVRIVVTHDNCPDGMASAILVADALRPYGAEFVFAQYGTQKYLELPAKTGMLFVDIAPPEHRASQFLECGAIVLDHHKSARPVVERFVDVGLGAFADEERDIGVSGALLAYRHVWKPLRDRDVDDHAAYRPGHAHAFAALAGVRDTWQRDDVRWNQALRASRGTALLAVVPMARGSVRCRLPAHAIDDRYRRRPRRSAIERCEEVDCPRPAHDIVARQTTAHHPVA